MAAPPESDAHWPQLDHAAAFSVFKASCSSALPRFPARYREAFERLCQTARTVREDEAERFLKTSFCLADPLAGFTTGYFEPVIDGRLKPEPGFETPLRAAPPNIVTLNARQVGEMGGFSHALRVEGRLRAMPNRAAIEEGALGHLAPPLVYVDRVEGFFAHIQGSVAVRLKGGRILRLGYAGKNGHPYTAIGRVLVSRGHMRLEDVTMDSLKAWLRANPAHADSVIRANASYVFFAVDEAASPALGPKGALGVPLTPGVSVAVDPAHHPLGLPLIVSGTVQGLVLPRLVIAQDVGSAIKSAGRIDLFLGSGEEAGQNAGRLKHDVTVRQLLPLFMCGRG